MLSGTAPNVIFTNKKIIEKGAVKMNKAELKAIWKKEEEAAHIHGWDFSHIRGRYEEEADLPNVELCRKTLLPFGIDFRPCDNPADIPFEDESFDMIINRHGDFNAKELARLLKKGGIFVTEQVGEDNDRDLVEQVLPNTKRPFPHLNLKEQKKVFEDAGFEIMEGEEAYRPIKFYDVGAFVWFARIIEWEFPEFSVDRCFERLLELQKAIEDVGRIEGTIHRYLIVARKSKSPLQATGYQTCSAAKQRRI
jgi:SAM-dependent methyltransferase